MLFLGFCLLMKEEKASRKRKNLLYKKVLNREFASEEFETLYKEFRNAFETKRIKFFDTYQWFECRYYVVFAGEPGDEEGYSGEGKPIQPNFVFEAERMIVKVGYSEAILATFYDWDDDFFMTHDCYPFNNRYLSIKKVSKSRYYHRLMEATKVALQSIQ